MRRVQCYLFGAIGIVSNLLLSVTARGATSVSWIEHLRVNVPEHAQLAAAADQLVGSLPATADPDLAVVTYRVGAAGIKNVVVQLFQGAGDDCTHILNPQGVARARVGESMADGADKFLGVALQPPDCYGDPDEIRRQRRALNLTFNGDLTLLREQTVEPLHIVAVLPHADRYLPSSLRSRVQAVVLTAQLDFGEWRGRLNFVTAKPSDAEHVGSIVGAWRDLAGSLAAQYASYVSGDRLRQALQNSTVTVVENRVTASAVIPASVLVRVAKEAAGHGGGCPPGGVCDRNKIAICHRTSGHGGQTLCVAPAAVPAHLAHGDYCGPCRQDGGGDGGHDDGHGDHGHGDDHGDNHDDDHGHANSR